MLLRAVQALATGKAVIVISARSEEHGHMKGLLRDHGVNPRHVRFTTLASLHTLRGLSKHHAVAFVDHWAVDRATGHEYEELRILRHRGLIE